jgi:uncharacterized membrane protein YphA (DoxX/SURF4 family)
MPGIALLLLRAVFGIALLFEGRLYIGDVNAIPAAWLVGVSALAGGALLLIGFLTPIIGGVVALGFLGVALSVVPACTTNIFNTRPAGIFALTMLVTLIGVGPGRFSIDARVFGRREIIIPPPITRPE